MPRAVAEHSARGPDASIRKACRSHHSDVNPYSESVGVTGTPTRAVVVWLSLITRTTRPRLPIDQRRRSHSPNVLSQSFSQRIYRDLGSRCDAETLNRRDQDLDQVGYRLQRLIACRAAANEGLHSHRRHGQTGIDERRIELASHVRICACVPKRTPNPTTAPIVCGGGWNRTRTDPARLVKEHEACGSDVARSLFCAFGRDDRDV